MDLWLQGWAERLRSSLFFVPMAFVVGGAILGEGVVRFDRNLVDAETLPADLQSTVDSAREVLTTVAAATITFAGIAFSVSVLVIQLASSQYSPRVMQGIFRDPFNKRVIGVVLGVFTYCLVVLRSVRSEVGDDGEEVVPALAVVLAVLFGVAAILAIVAFIDHSAHAIDLSQLLGTITADAMSTIRRTWSGDDAADDDTDGADGDRDRGGGGPARGDPVPATAGHVITFDGDGWIQQLEERALIDIVPPGGTVRLDTAVGRYAIGGTPLCTVWPTPDDPDLTAEMARAAVRVGATRTAEQDPAYGIRQLVDVGLRALSTGVNDPTTAQDAIFHLGSVLRELLVREPPREVRTGEKGRRLVRSEAHSHQDVVDLAFSELRRSAAALPTVCVYLLETMHLLCQAVGDDPDDPRLAPLRDQARLVVDGCEHADVLADDVALVRAAYRSRFGEDAAPTPVD